MDFEFSPEQLAFAAEVERVPRRARRSRRVRPHPREHGPDRRHAQAPRLHAQLGERGWLGLTWPKEYGGSEGEGVYEYLLNEALGRPGGPQIGKGVGIIGKTIIKPGERVPEAGVPAQDPAQRRGVRGRLQRAQRRLRRRVDAAQGRARRARRQAGWILNGQKTWTTSAHFAEWYWLGTRTDPDNKHRGITLMLVPLDQPGMTINGIWTMGDERTNEVFIDDVFVPDEYVVGEVNRGFQYISQALDLERFTMFTISPINQRLDLLIDYVTHGDARRRAAARTTRWSARIAKLATDAEVSRVLGLHVSWPRAGEKAPGRPPPTTESSEYKLFATESPAASPTPRWTSAGRARSCGCAPRRTHGRPGRVDLPLHRDRHHRRRRVGDPEEHHRPARARPPEELLAPVVDRLLSGVTVLDLSSVGPAARTSRLARRLRRARGEGRAAAQAVGRADRAALLRYSGHRGMERVLLDLKASTGRDAFLRLAARADVVIESFRPGVVDRLGIGVRRGAAR